MPYAILGFICFGSVFYLEQEHPDIVHDILIKVDTLGFTKVGATEQKRIAQIKALPIPYEKKQVLIDRTIFMGASTTMVYLALGEPRSSTVISPTSSDDGNKVEQWFYHFENDMRPTILEFEKGILITARKASLLEIKDGPPHR